MQRIVIGGRDHVASLPGSSRFVTPRRVAFITMSQGTISKVSGMPRQFLAPVNYPDSDGEPMSDNTLQWDTIAYLITVIRHWFSPRPDVFVAGNLLWYYEEGNPKARIGPDCLVSFGRPPGYRGSYMQWVEDGICPQVVFEVLSPKNTKKEMEAKYELYARLGCEEYYLIDPYRRMVGGFHRVGQEIVDIADAVGQRSALLHLTLGFREDFFDLRQDDGHSLLRPDEMAAIASSAPAQLATAQATAGRLRAKLIAAGIDPDA